MGFKTMGCWFLGLAGGAIALVGFGGWYLQQQLTQVPPRLEAIPSHGNTYERHQALQQEAAAVIQRLQAERSAQPEPGRSAQPQAQNPNSQTQFPSASPDPTAVTITLSPRDLNALLAFGLSQGLEGKGAQQIVTATQVEFLPHTLKTSALLDLSKVSVADLQGGDRLSILRRLEQIPGLKDRPIYVAAEGKPVVRDRALSLQDLTLTVGSLRLTLADAAHYLGVSEAILQESLDRELRNLPIELERIELTSAATSSSESPRDSPAAPSASRPSASRPSASRPSASRPSASRLELTGNLTAW